MISSRKMKFVVTAAAATAVVCTGALAANVTSTTDVNVRSGPGNSYSVLTVMKKGTTTAQLAKSGSWTKVTVNGKTGYVCTKYLTSGSSSSTTSSTTAASTSKTVYITASALNVRSGPSTSYSVIGGLAKGNSAAVVGTSGNWYKIKYGSGYGYISSSYTSSTKPSGGSTVSSTSPTLLSSKTKTMYCTASSLNVRSGPSTSYGIVGRLSKGSSATIVGTSGSWYKIQYGSGYGYVSSSYMSSTKPASTSPTVTSTSTPSSSSSGSSIVSYAKGFLGCRYSYGAAGPSSFDCSGFTQYVYKHFGKSLPRSSSAQYASATKVSKSNLRPGDLVFFSNSSSGGSVGHVAIYIGNGQIIHAANSSTGVCISSLNSSYYTQHYISGGRY